MPYQPSSPPTGIYPERVRDAPGLPTRRDTDALPRDGAGCVPLRVQDWERQMLDPTLPLDSTMSGRLH